MATRLQKDASPTALRNARQIADLKVNEVSVVDRPAIRRQFLILKRHLEEGAEVDGITKAELEQATKVVETALEEANKDVSEEMQKSLGAVVPWLHRMAKQAEGAARQQLLQAAAFLDLAQTKSEDEDMNDKQKTETEEERKVREAKEAEEAAAKEKEEQEKAAATAKAPPPPGGAPGGAAPGMAPDEEEDPDAMKAKTQKKQKALSLDGSEEVGVVKRDAEGNLYVVTKGRKSFTQERIDTLKATTLQMATLLKEADPDSFVNAMEELAKQLPAGAKVPQMVKPMGMGGVASMSVSKSEDDPRDAQIAELTKRLETLEKARAPSSSLEDAGGSDNKTEVKKSMWSGVL